MSIIRNRETSGVIDKSILQEEGVDVLINIDYDKYIYTPRYNCFGSIE